jgi:hypothetical protein
MARIYVTTEDGRHVLHEIQCDSCGVKTKPGNVDGWLVVGSDHGLGTDKVRLYYCRECRYLINEKQ